MTPGAFQGQKTASDRDPDPDRDRDRDLG